MNTSTALSHQGHRLLQVGVALFLFTSLEGFAIPYLALASPWTVGAYAQCLAGRPPAGAGARMAQAQSRRHDLPDRVLASNLSDLRHLGRLRDG